MSPFLEVGWPLPLSSVGVCIGLESALLVEISLLLLEKLAGNVTGRFARAHFLSDCLFHVGVLPEAGSLVRLIIIVRQWGRRHFLSILAFLVRVKVIRVSKLVLHQTALSLSVCALPCRFHCDVRATMLATPIVISLNSLLLLNGPIVVQFLSGR